MKDYRDKLAVLFLSVLLFFLFLEMSSMLLLPLMKINHGYVTLGVAGKHILEYPGVYLRDKDLFWRLEPLKADFNSFGYRDREFSVRKEKGTFRVVCIGDSVTFGFPVQKDNTYPKALERLLQKRFPSMKTEVLNLGVPGYTSYQGLELFKKEVLMLEPDAVVVYYGLNDMSAAFKADKDQPRLPSWLLASENQLNKLYFYRLFTKIALHFKYPAGKNDYPGLRVSPRDYKRNLQQIESLAKDNKMRVLFIVQPAFFDVEEQRIVSERRYEPPEKVNCLDIYTLFKKREKEAAALFIDDVRPLNFHLSEAGQRLLAEAVSDCLAKDIYLGS